MRVSDPDFVTVCYYYDTLLKYFLFWDVEKGLYGTYPLIPTLNYDIGVLYFELNILQPLTSVSVRSRI